MAKYKKKPIVIEAVQYTGTEQSIVDAIALPEAEQVCFLKNELHVCTLEGVMTASLNDWIIKGVGGEVYPCKPDIFEKTYDLVEEKEND